jgi:hypothetical protein
VIAAVVAGCGTGNGGPIDAGTASSGQGTPATSTSSHTNTLSPAGVASAAYTCRQLRAVPARQYRLFVYIAHQLNGPNSLYTTNQAKHIARNVTESFCTTYGPKIYPWNPGVAFDKAMWREAYSGGVSPDDPGIAGPIEPIGNCNTDPAC